MSNRTLRIFGRGKTRMTVFCHKMVLCAVVVVVFFFFKAPRKLSCYFNPAAVSLFSSHYVVCWQVGI